MRRNLRTWVRNLRSPKFKQAYRTLVKLAYGNQVSLTVVGYCCLGVACEINPHTVREGGYFYDIREDGELERDSLGYKVRSSSILTPSTTQWLGLNVHTPCVKLSGTDKWVGLATLNDSQLYSFAEIADIIEAQDKDWDGKVPTEDLDKVLTDYQLRELKNSA